MSGQWVRRGLVWAWDPAAEPPPKPEPVVDPPLDVDSLIACPTCRVRIYEPCRTNTGAATVAHQDRIIARRCICGGALPTKWARYCEGCRVERRRESWRLYGERRKEAA